MKKILLINGHPDSESFNFALHESYKKGAVQSGAEIQEIIIRELEFNPNLQFGYRKRTELEPDLLESINKIQWAEHIVIFHPVWWGSYPALLKGFIDRTFLSGITFKYRENSVWWDKLLTGKTGHIVATLDQPAWYYWLVFGRPSYNSLKKSTLEFCGVKPVKTTSIGPIRNSADAFREKWISKLEKLGFEQK